MSRRFGRNQKRKMRAELAHVLEREEKLNKAYWREQALMSDLSKSNDVLRETINLTEKVLGQYFATLPPKTIDVNEEFEMPRKHWDMTIPPRALSDYLDMSEPLKAKFDIIRAAVMRGEAWIDALLGQMHVRFVSPAGDVAYVFTPNVFRNMPPEYAARALAKNMANYLINNPEFQQFIGINRKK